MSDESLPAGRVAGSASKPESQVPVWGREKAILIIAGVFILMRAIYLGFPNLFPEEAYYWNYAKHLDYGYLDHPPMVAWLIGLGTALFGDREFGVRVFAFGSSLVATFYVYCLTRLLHGRRAAAFATLLMQALPIFFLTGFIMTPDAPLTACWAGALYFLARVFFARRAASWWGVGIFLGLGMLSKYTIALLGPATLLFVVLDKESRFWLRHAAPYGAALLALLIFSPVIVWNFAHHWASFAFQSANRVREPRRFSLHELIGAVLVWLTPLGAGCAGHALARGGDRPTALPAGTADREADDEGRGRRLLFARVFTFVPLSVFVAFSLVHRVKLNWTGPLWLAVLPSVAALIATAMSEPGQRLARLGWEVTVAGCGVLYLAVLQHLAFGIPGLGYAKNIDLMPIGWSEMGKEIENEAAELRRTVPANVPVRIVGMDRNFIASEAAFYHSDPARAALETPGANLFGKPSLMYAYWFPPAAQDGAALLLVSFEHGGLERSTIREHAQPQAKIRTHWLTRHGRKIRPYYTLPVLNYHSVSSP